MLNRGAGVGGSRDVWVLSTANVSRRPFVHTPVEDVDASFSEDSRYVAYQSGPGGRYEVYVEAFPEGGTRRQVSQEGGTNPYWRADGRELFYVDRGGRLMVVQTDTRQAFRYDAPEHLFNVRLRPGADGRQVVVTRDGQRILVNELEEELEEENASAPINVIVNWRARDRGSRSTDN